MSQELTRCDKKQGTPFKLQLRVGAEPTYSYNGSICKLSFETSLCGSLTLFDRSPTS